MRKSRILGSIVVLSFLLFGYGCSRNVQAVGQKQTIADTSSVSVSAQPAMKTQATLTRSNSVEIVNVRCPNGQVVTVNKPVETEKETISCVSDEANIISSLPNATYQINLKGRSGKTGDASFVWTAADGTQLPPLQVNPSFDKSGKGWVKVTLNLTKPDKTGKSFRVVVPGGKEVK